MHEPEPTPLELLAIEADLQPYELRDYLYREIERRLGRVRSGFVLVVDPRGQRLLEATHEPIVPRPR